MTIASLISFSDLCLNIFIILGYISYIALPCLMLFVFCQIILLSFSNEPLWKKTNQVSDAIYRLCLLFVGELIYLDFLKEFAQKQQPYISLTDPTQVMTWHTTPASWCVGLFIALMVIGGGLILSWFLRLCLCPPVVYGLITLGLVTGIIGAK